MSTSRQLCAHYPITIVVLIGAVLLIEILVQLLQYPNFINPDCSYQLITAKQILDGGNPIKDFVFTSQPIWFYLNTVIWCISTVCHVSIQTTWIYSNWLIITLTAVMTGIVVRRARTDRENDWLALGCMFSSFLLLHLSMVFHVGQKELLFMSGYFPLFLMRWQRWQGHSQSPLPAIAGAIFCTIIAFVEPILLAIPLSVEIGFFCAWSRIQGDGESSRIGALKRVFQTPEMSTIGITTAILLLCSLIIPSQQEYYFRWVPLLIEGHQVYFHNWNRLLWLASSDGDIVGSRLLVVLICLTAFVIRGKCSFFIPLLFWTSSAWLIYILDGSGDAHRTIPFVFGFFLIAGIECMLLSKWFLSKIVSNKWISTLSKSGTNRFWLSDLQSRSLLVLTLFGVILLPVLPILIRDSMVTTKVTNPLDKVVSGSTAPGDPVLILGTKSTSSCPTLLNLNRKPGSRFAWSFALDMASYAKLNSKSKYNWALEQSKIVNELVEDIGRLRPKLIAIEASPSTTSRLSGSLYQRLAEQSVFVKALSNYSPAGIRNGYAVWLLRSKDISRAAPTSFLPGLSPIQ
ncbi:MAG: hypothetical protein K2X93_07690 [Candidatus Obscuribacterales bacterium]|nr:hypothetical protein [Candidatus Obscuribacterales bacterium]